MCFHCLFSWKLFDKVMLCTSVAQYKSTLRMNTTIVMFIFDVMCSPLI